MRRSISALAALAAVALAGCGSSASHPAASTPVTTSSRATTSTAGKHDQTTPRAESAGRATLCGQLKARLEGIEHTAAMSDPQPRALEGHRVVPRVERASGEAVEISRGYLVKLRDAQAPGASKQAVRRAERGYRRLERTLRRTSTVDPYEGLRIQAAFLNVAAQEVRGCLAQA